MFAKQKLSRLRFDTVFDVSRQASSRHTISKLWSDILLPVIWYEKLTRGVKKVITKGLPGSFIISQDVITQGGKKQKKQRTSSLAQVDIAGSCQSVSTHLNTGYLNILPKSLVYSLHLTFMKVETFEIIKVSLFWLSIMLMVSKSDKCICFSTWMKYSL